MDSELDKLLDEYGGRTDPASRESYRYIMNVSLGYFYSDGIGDDYNAVHRFVVSVILGKLREIAHWQHVLNKPEEPF